MTISINDPEDVANARDEAREQSSNCGHKPKRGGARPGAGRPPKDKSARHGLVRVTAWVTPREAKLVARARVKAGRTIGELLVLICREIDEVS